MKKRWGTKITGRWMKLFCLGACLLFMLQAGAVLAKYNPSMINWNSLYIRGEQNQESSKICVSSRDTGNWILVPANASPEEVPVYINIPNGVRVTAIGSKSRCRVTNGALLNLTELCGTNEYSLTFRAERGSDYSEYDVSFLFSENIAAMYLVSDDPVNHGRRWVEASPDKSNKATGQCLMQWSDGTISYDGALTQIKGRGNSTWGYEKKPYQIKLESKTDLLATGDKDNRSKTWVLLANASDPSLLRNVVALNLGTALGMDAYVENTYVDLYYDGEYRGNYLLSEKVEIGSGRVDIADLEEENEKTNDGVDIEKLQISSRKTANGARYTYCMGMKSPDDVTGGYLLEMDYSDRAVNEACYFVTTRGQHVVVKSPEFASQKEMEYIASFYQEFEDAVWNGGTNRDTGKYYTEYVDIDSMAKCYLINEFTKNRDGFGSSSYLYKDKNSDQMIMGPLWDYDLSLGKGGGAYDEVQDAYSLLTARSPFGRGICRLADFRKCVGEIYLRTMQPLVEQVLMGDVGAVSGDGNLHSLAYYQNQIAGSQVCSAKIWSSEQAGGESAEHMKQYIQKRTVILNEIFSAWVEDSRPLEYWDVPFGVWYYPWISEVTEYGLMQGKEEFIFEPHAWATRAQVVQTIYNMVRKPAVQYKNIFTDVKEEWWYADAITWAAENQVTNGYLDGTFRPEQTITREELVTLLYRFLESPEAEPGSCQKFMDAADISNYAKNAMEWAVTEGILQGYTDGTLRPKASANRAELAAILARIYVNRTSN